MAQTRDAKINSDIFTEYALIICLFACLFSVLSADPGMRTEVSTPQKHSGTRAGHRHTTPARRSHESNHTAVAPRAQTQAPKGNKSGDIYSRLQSQSAKGRPPPRHPTTQHLRYYSTYWINRENQFVLRNVTSMSTILRCALRVATVLSTSLNLPTPPCCRFNSAKSVSMFPSKAYSGGSP